ncbi:IS110 family transposase [Spirochaetota bacterium]
MVVNIGVDLHKTQFTVSVRDWKNQYAEYQTNDEGYKKFLSRVSAWQKKGAVVRVGVESTGNTRFFKNQMEQAGVEVVVINTLKFKVVNESVKKTDRHDAATIAEFLEKDMLPEAKLCSEQSEQLRRLIKVRTTLVRTNVTVKNQIHALLTGLGMKDSKASLQSKRGRQKVLDALKAENGLVVQPLFETIERLEENVKLIEKELEKLTEGDDAVRLLLTIPGCGPITAWTIRAFTDDINRFSSAKKYSAYAGLVPWVQNSNETVHHGRITKRGPEELRTALVQLVLGMRRCKQTLSWRLMERYNVMKSNKGSGKSIIATARKVSKIVWCMLAAGEEFNVNLMVDKKLKAKADEMRNKAKKSA